ncbi:hypothetical protein [Afifella pfennigii]|uniref:hypothetical protein n=1 Tax=Afifella pfennigii TaxID=209897 RepID=UPI00047A178A|nr:hypothetical protein [Afifella pfennigii]
MPKVFRLTIRAHSPVLTGIDHYWSVIRDLGRGGATFTATEVFNQSKQRRLEAVSDYLRRLAKAEYLEIVEPHRPGGRRKTRPTVYRLLRRPTETPHPRRDGTPARQGLGQAQMWTAIRALDAFTAAELAVAASTEEVSVARATALSYCKALKRAGYLTVVSPAGPGRAEVWRLRPSMKKGRPEAPKILRTKVVYDPNTGEIWPRPVEAEEVSP